MKEIQWLYLHPLYSKTCPTGGAGQGLFIAINYEFDNCTESYNVTKANDVSDKKIAGNECKTKLCNDAMSLNLQLLNCAQVFCSIYHFKVDTGKCCLKSIESSQFVYPAGDIYFCLLSGKVQVVLYLHVVQILTPMLSPLHPLG